MLKRFARLGWILGEWDYGLIDDNGELIAVPRHYRDARNKQAMDEVCEAVSREEIFEKTGLQFMQINTLFQMGAMKKHEPELLDNAAQFLLIPDLINLRLTGKAFCERTNASTTQFYNPVKKRWSIKLFEKIGVPLEQTPELIEAGESLGPVKDDIAAETGPSFAYPGCHGGKPRYRLGGRSGSG